MEREREEFAELFLIWCSSGSAGGSGVDGVKLSQLLTIPCFLCLLCLLCFYFFYVSLISLSSFYYYSRSFELLEIARTNGGRCFEFREFFD